jgi:D-glycero-D-manno-heptose 1,7-bisphosphate phosphatase
MCFLPGAAEAVAMLKTAGWLCIGVTNQPDVSRGTRTRSGVEAMNNRVVAEPDLDDIFACFHDDRDGCGCRKPKPGMLFEAAEKWNLNFGAGWLVGDPETDVAAGGAGGCRTLRIAAGEVATAANAVLPDALAAARYILCLENDLGTKRHD